MKKLIALVAVVAMILTMFTLPTSAAVEGMINEGNHWAVNSPKHEEIIAGEAGERDIAWEVPWLKLTPTLDGKIGKGEYLPFEMYEDYLAYMAIATGNTEEDFAEFYELTRYGFFDAYWGWDGVYMYIAFEVDTVNGHTCTPEVLGATSYLYAYNMLQVGIAPVDSTERGQGNSYVELGFGVHSETNESLTFNWFGNYCPKAGEDFIGYYDEDNQVLRYEIRIHLQTALGLTDRLVENGDAINYAWVLSVNGETTGPYDVWHLFFCHGISGPHSKNAANMARITFTGKPDGLDIPVADIPGMSQEDIDYMLREYVDMSDENVVKTFEGENAGVEYVTEGEESFMRITSLSNTDIPYVYSNKYPRNIVGGQGDYVVVKYRTSSPEADGLGLIFRNVFDKEYHPDDCYTDLIGTDGEWHTTIFYMLGENNWQHFILNVGLVPFAYSDKSAQETLDIAWIKFYQNDPTDIYESQFYDPDTGATEAPTDVPTEAPTEAPVIETSEKETNAPDVGVSETEAPTTAEKGCASVLGSVAVILTAACAAVVMKKKEN